MGLLMIAGKGGFTGSLSVSASNDVLGAEIASQVGYTPVQWVIILSGSMENILFGHVLSADSEGDESYSCFPELAIRIRSLRNSSDTTSHML